MPFLHEVRAGRVWCPEKRSVRSHTCVQPPLRSAVQDELVRLMMVHLPVESNPDRPGVLRLVRYLKKRPANREWLLDVIYCCTNGVHLYFERHYRPPPLARGVQARITLQNEDGFFNGLPESRSKGKRGSGAVMGPEERQLLREQRMQRQIESLENRLNYQRQRR